MPIEIDLGEKLGIIVIERKKTVRSLLSNLVKDKLAIADAIRRYDSTKFVERGQFVGDEGVSPARILITNFKEPPFMARIMGCRSVSYKLFVDGAGRLIEKAKWSPTPLKLEGVDLGGRTDFLDVRYLPEWISRSTTPELLKVKIDSLFYPRG
ncbi:MAG: hypothetical protein UX13_C0014G0003 [Candidatus Woesebacteria bacterium GW2011_GWB1_45_5]|uniref:Uncharacterized protein n=1 Tax=Candidatus Woesebacteria bacterium GW2011_GWB1_45_5 TaxID=1618581 RepID=A0A0G1QNX3_9BACT|nr:MAG: hypothetical protein UX13_C0014G0003 [Candidatus Woesebacteria bacterium GW2011_GWB1_45_5]